MSSPKSSTLGPVSATAETSACWRPRKMTNRPSSCGTRNMANASRDLRSARRVEQYLDVNVSVGTIFFIFRANLKKIRPTRSHAPMCCKSARSRSGPVTFCTARPPCWSIARATACTALHSIRHSEPTSSRMATSRCPRRDLLLGQRGQPRQFSDRLPGIRSRSSRRENRSSSFLALCRLFARGGLSPHPAQRGHFLLPTDSETSPRQAPPDVRSQSDCLSRRASRRTGYRRSARRILDIQPDSLHQRTPLAMGSRRKMSLLAEMLKRHQAH